jgi:hypothetical protein
LDARHPERTKLRPRDVDGLIEALDVIDAVWTPTIERARQLPASTLHERVNGEYSFLETLRHLVFASDAWLMRVVRGVEPGYHEWAVPPGDLPLDATGGPGFDSVLEVRAERMGWQRDYLSNATQSDLDRIVATPGWHPQDEPALYCFRVVLHDEWWHHQFATRDLAILKQA